MDDIGRFGGGVVTPRYWKVREFWAFGRSCGWDVHVYRIDEHGEATKAGSGTLSEGEEIDDVPTLEEAIAEHMAPAAAEASTNSKRLAEKKKREAPAEPPKPKPPPMDPATQRFYYDGE